MTYEMTELLVVGEAGCTIEATKELLMDEVSGTAGPNDRALEDE